jgi:2Fe-2S ferredoxin
VDDAWAEKTGTPSTVESEMLEAASAERKPNSRLSCQMTVTQELAGLVVYLPATQF